ncbi:MAG: DUF6754 domain-containing protein [Candidatus Cloacimonas sp.]
MKKYLIIIGIILLIGISLLSTDKAKPEISQGKISEFSATDMPYDDGAGVVLKWKPLDKSYHIIYYNIYRGVSPDSLFLLSNIEVDPKLGVLSNELYFYDRGDQPLIEFETAPVNLKKEKQQSKDSPLYSHFPQQPALLASVLDRYNVLGAINNSKLYHRSAPIKKGEDLMAGLKMRHFESILGFPKAGQEYYYTILGVNERGQYLPYADIQKVVPEDNPPEPATIFSSTYFEDTGVFNFEWNPPTSSPDIAMWEGWLVPKTLTQANGGALTENWQNSAVHLFQIPNYYGSVNACYSVDTKKEGIELPQNMADYYAVLSFSDYLGQSAAVPAKHFRILNSAQQLKMPKIAVYDKINDKGDYLTVSIGRPLVFVSQALYLNKAKTALKINYEVSNNEHYKIKELRFTVLDSLGKEIGKVSEHYLDKTVHIKLPKQYEHISNMNVRIAVRTNDEQNFEDYTEQHIVYDNDNKIFRGQNIYYQNEPVNKLYYEVLTRNGFDPDFMFGNRTNGLTRSYDHSIPYESTVYERILNYDAKGKYLLLDPQLTIAIDSTNGYSFAVPLYRTKFEKDLKQQKSELDKLLDQKKMYAASALPESLQNAIQEAEGTYNFIIHHPAYLAATKAKTDKSWLKSLLSVREKNMRSYSYRLIKTDGKANFITTATFTNPKGISVFYPKSEWFDSTKYITLGASILLLVLLIYAIILSRKGDVYIRPIAGLESIEEAVGRATEMGRPLMYVPGWGTLGDPDTVASMMILGQVAKKAAEFDVRLISPHCDYMVLPMAQEIIQNSFNEVGRPDAYNPNDIFFISYDQFPFCAGVNGITVRERVATIFYMGFFNAEALLLTETGNQVGAFQIAGTDAITQVPFFITTCSYTLIGEEFYAASAYISHNPDLVSMLKASDYFKVFIIVALIVGTILATFNFTGFINALPIE